MFYGSNMRIVQLPVSTHSRPATQPPQDHSLKPAFSLAAIVHVTFLCVCLTNQKLAF